MPLQRPENLTKMEFLDRFWRKQNFKREKSCCFWRRVRQNRWDPVNVEVLTTSSRWKDCTDLRQLKDLTFKDKRLVLIVETRDCVCHNHDSNCFSGCLSVSGERHPYPHNLDDSWDSVWKHDGAWFMHHHPRSVSLSWGVFRLSLSHIEYRNSLCFVCPSSSEHRERDEHTNSNTLETLSSMLIIHTPTRMVSLTLMWFCHIRFVMLSVIILSALSWSLTSLSTVPLPLSHSSFNSNDHLLTDSDINS
jgi:hypothetical protein